MAGSGVAEMAAAVGFRGAESGSAGLPGGVFRGTSGVVDFKLVELDDVVVAILSMLRREDMCVDFDRISRFYFYHISS